MYFENRKDAGRKLAEKLLSMRGKDVAILAIPRG
jgi:predicted phosphoribosyltransferase